MLEKCDESKDHLKIIISDKGDVIPDIYDKLPYSGHWINFRKTDVWKFMCEQFSVLKSTEIKCKYSDLLKNIEKQLKGKIFSKLALARKSGDAFCGFEKVKISIKSKDVEVLFQACDGSKRELSRLKKQTSKITTVTLFNSRELGTIFDRDHIAHACILRSGIARSLLLDVKRVEGIRN